MTHAQDQSPADWALRGATVHAENGVHEALAVRGERLVYVGDEAGLAAWIGPGTRVVDGAGLHVYPGLVDAHAHLYSLGRYLTEIQLTGSATLAEAQERVRAGLGRLAPGEWVLGRNWDQNLWPEKVFPHRRDLDAVVGERPALLRRVDGHAAWLSSAALRAAGITRDTRDPDGGRVVRDDDGEPTGVLIDNAIDLVRAVVPAPDTATVRRRLLRAQQACLEAGLTGMHDMGVGEADLEALRQLDDTGALRLRVYAMLSDDSTQWARELPRGPQLPAAGKRLTVRGVKLYADGALGSRGAALLADYSDDPGNQGLLLTPVDSLAPRVRRAAAAGYQPAIHAIGDRANRVVLDAFAAALSADEARRLRPRIEHVQVLHADEIPRFARQNVIASMQPTHCTSDMPWAPARLGPERVKGAYAWRDLLNTGARLALGSDFPVESHDPRLGLHAAVTRQRPDGSPPGGWAPDQRLSVAEAVAGFAREAAYASFQESELGTIAPGKYADLTIFDRDLAAGPPAAILQARVAATVIGGRVEFAAEPARWPGPGK